MNGSFDFTFGENMSLDSIMAGVEAERNFTAPSAAAYAEPPDGMNHMVFNSREEAIGDGEPRKQEPVYRDEASRRRYRESSGVDTHVYQVYSDPPEQEYAGQYPQQEQFREQYYQQNYGQYPREEQYYPPPPEGQYYQEEQPPQNGQYYQEEQYSQGGQYYQEEQYSQGGQYYQDGQPPPEGQYYQEEQYPPEGPYEGEYNDGPPPKGKFNLDLKKLEFDFKEKVLDPVVALIGAAAERRREKIDQKVELQHQQAEAQRRQGPRNRRPELRADKASRFYWEQAGALKLRCILATAVALALIWLSYGLPAFGVLGKSPSVRALVCLVLLLTVMIIGLDVMTNGLISLIRGKPGIESLIAASCFVTSVDALVIALTGNTDVGLPFCGASALSMVFALWGNRLSCQAFSLSFRAASRVRDPNVVMSAAGLYGDSCVLIKARRPVTGFVRTAETADIFENAYRLAAPVLMAGSVILSLLCFLASKKCTNLLHTFAACTAGTASLSGIFGFALPFWMLTKRLYGKGMAIAGCSGAAELGRLDRILLMDTDLFPPGTMALSNVDIAPNAYHRTVISCTGSLIAAAGLGVAPVFTELMRRNNCPLMRVENFACHEGGGLVAHVNGDQVYVGSASFMELMGVKLPESRAKTPCTVFTAMNCELVGIFSLNYTPMPSVQAALKALLGLKVMPVLAVRDFSVTQELIQRKFRFPSVEFEFPATFAECYRVSSRDVQEDSTVSAVFSKGGLNSVAALIRRGRKFWTIIRAILILSLLASLLIPVIMLALCWSGSFESASCGNLMTYMLLCQLPVVILSINLS